MTPDANQDSTDHGRDPDAGGPLLPRRDFLVCAAAAAGGRVVFGVGPEPFRPGGEVICAG